MKIWFGYGSEHSANLVMIGTFKDANRAQEVKQILDSLGKQQAEDAQSSSSEDPPDQYTEGMLSLLQKLHVHSVTPAEMEQLNYDVRVEVKGNEIHVTTDEIDVSAFLKIFIDQGARVQVYSAHPDE